MAAEAEMGAHLWLIPSATLVTKVRHARARTLLRLLPSIPANRLGAWAAAWPPLLSALPALLREDPARLLDAVGRVDVLAALQTLTQPHGDAGRIERGLVTLWLALAGHPGLIKPIALPGPFRERVVDPGAPRLVAFGDVRGLAATARGAVVIARTGRMPIDAFAVMQLPAVEHTVIVDTQLEPPDDATAARIRNALASTRSAVPGGSLERVTVGSGEAALGEARVGPAGDSADLVRSAQAAFTKAAAEIEPPFRPGGMLIEQGRYVQPVDLLARVSGDAVALPWQNDRAAAVTKIVEHLNDLAVLADPTPIGTEVIAAIRSLHDGESNERRRALLVNIDADDFVYGFQFGRSVERRCVERGLQVDRITINLSKGRDLAVELGQPIPAPIADGTETVVDSEQDDAALVPALRRLSSRRYEVVVANVRPHLFYDLLVAGFFGVRTLVWDRHLHGGLREEGARRQIDPAQLSSLPVVAWSLDKKTGPGLQPSLAQAGLQRGSGQIWPLDLDFFQSNVARHDNRVFAGGENQRDWPLFVEAVRDLPFEVHLVSSQAPATLPPNVRVDSRLPLSRFRDAMGSAAIAAVPLSAGAAAGVTVIPMAMALGVAIVATRTPWTEPLVRDGEEALLVPPGAVDAFRSALLRVHEQPDLRRHLVTNARKRVAEICDLEAFTRAMFATIG